MPTLEDNRWTPVRSGPHYCSPACGGNCTHMAYLEAQAEAQQLLDDLGPPTGVARPGRSGCMRTWAGMPACA